MPFTNSGGFVWVLQKERLTDSYTHSHIDWHTDIVSGKSKGRYILSSVHHENCLPYAAFLVFFRGQILFKMAGVSKCMHKLIMYGDPLDLILACYFNIRK